MQNHWRLTDSQLMAEADKCFSCAEKPCMKACPAQCSPAEFILAIRCAQPSDFKRAALGILKSNPLGQVCGITCPDTFCMQACTRGKIDRPINIPAVQASILAKARELGVLTPPHPVPTNGKKLAVVGAGPAGLAATAVLARLGYEVEIFDAKREVGGAARLIPDDRLSCDILAADRDFVLSLGQVTQTFDRKIDDPATLMQLGFSGVIVATGEQDVTKLGILGDELATTFVDYLEDHDRFAAAKRVAIIGGGAVAVDCAITAKRLGAEVVEMFVRRTIGDMRLTPDEFSSLLSARIDITTRSRLTTIEKSPNSLTLKVNKVEPKDGRLVDIPGTEIARPGFDLVIYALGAKAAPVPTNPAIFLAGDLAHGGSTVVEAVASGKNAAQALHHHLTATPKSSTTTNENARACSAVRLHNIDTLPVDLSTDFFGRTIPSPFLLSAAPATDGYDQMVRAYRAGWAGGVMKTAFDGIPIHIPAAYMHSFTSKTFANCDNVSDHSLDRVCREIERLRMEFPDRLTVGSTGGPVTGNWEADRAAWQSNTKKLENAGALAVEYSLSCPQGGDGTEGDIVSQNAELSARIIEWVLQVGDSNIPKLFKLTAAVTSIKPIINAIAAVYAKYPNKKAGVTLANSFPSLGFRQTPERTWDEARVVGMSGEGVLPISYLTLANVASSGVTVSGNGGPMNYLHAAHFLALGAKTVQFCSITMKYGVEIITDLNSGLSHYLQARGLHSVTELIGLAGKNPITDFMELTPVKQIPSCDKSLCISCGNCTRCGYLAVQLDANGHAQFDSSRCVGCTFCTQHCPSGALCMIDR